MISSKSNQFSKIFQVRFVFLSSFSFSPPGDAGIAIVSYVHGNHGDTNFRPCPPATGSFVPVPYTRRLLFSFFSCRGAVDAGEEGTGSDYEDVASPWPGTRGNEFDIDVLSMKSTATGVSLVFPRPQPNTHHKWRYSS